MLECFQADFLCYFWSANFLYQSQPQVACHVQISLKRLGKASSYFGLTRNALESSFDDTWVSSKGAHRHYRRLKARPNLTYPSLSIKANQLGCLARWVFLPQSCHSKLALTMWANSWLIRIDVFAPLVPLFHFIWLWGLSQVRICAITGQQMLPWAPGIVGLGWHNLGSYLLKSCCSCSNAAHTRKLPGPEQSLGSLINLHCWY